MCWTYCFGEVLKIAQKGLKNRYQSVLCEQTDTRKYFFQTFQSDEEVSS